MTARERQLAASPPTRIFVVDDHPVTAEGLSELLAAEADLDVVGHAPDSDAALTGIESSTPDLVIVDITLQESNGLDLVRRLAKVERSPRVLVVSMHDEMLFAERSIELGAMGYVSKEAPIADLLAAIRQVAAGRIYLSASVAQQVLGPGRKRPGLAALSARELEVFAFMGEGLTTRDIAAQLGVSVKTVETHRERIKVKLGVGSHFELLRHAVAWTLSARDPLKGPNGAVSHPA